MIVSAKKPERNSVSTFPTSNEELYRRLTDSVHVMGIVNVTPDSFSDGGQFDTLDRALGHARQLIDDGADLLDIGGESTRPGSDPVPADEELRRVIPVIEGIRSFSSVPLSIDTTKSEVARAALRSGANVINDISGTTFDPKMTDAVAEHGAILVIMHMLGTPKTMQQDPHYDDVVREVRQWLDERAATLRSRGIQRLVVDPGFGFGKRLADNFQLLARLDSLRTLGYPLLVGTSRKSFLGALFNAPPEDRLEGTLISNILAVMKGATILRVHDVRQVRRALSFLQAVEHHASD
jgi:dihydropteroate synthase